MRINRGQEVDNATFHTSGVPKFLSVANNFKQRKLLKESEF